jgi:hypothetical protein
MKLKLFDFEKYEDFGKEWFFQVLTSPKFALFDFTLQWDDYSGDELFPAISLSMGSHHLFGFFIIYKRFQFACSIIDTKPRNLEWYRRNNDAVLS